MCTPWSMDPYFLITGRLILILALDPFFLYFAPDSSHAPVYASEAFRGKSRRGAYGDAVMELDWAVGQIISALESNNLLDDTIVIFSSDNGAACVGGTKEQEGSNGPLLCCKQTTMDGGMRVPGLGSTNCPFKLRDRSSIQSLRYLIMERKS